MKKKNVYVLVNASALKLRRKVVANVQLHAHLRRKVFANVQLHACSVLKDQGRTDAMNVS